MQNMWLELLPDKTLEGGIKLLNELAWNIEIQKRDDVWEVWTGDHVAFSASSREAVDAFLFGMALAYSVLPDDIMSQLRKFAYDATH